MLLNQVNLNYLRIFEAVFRTGSMTQAAQELYLTQSGISQHIKSLEDALELKLFDRIKQKLLPTEEGKQLYSKIYPQLKNLEEALRQVTSQDDVLRGEVTIGMPVVFGLNVVLPFISEVAKEHKELKFHLKFDLAHAMNQMLLDGEIDFAFVDDFAMDPQVKTEKVYDEELCLCCSTEYYKSLGKKGSSKLFFESMAFIAYAKGEPIVRRWLQHHVRGGNYNLNIKARIADTLAIEKFITSDLGAGVLPRHQLFHLQDQGYELTVIEEKQKVLKNKISLAYLSHRSLSLPVQETRKFLVDKIKAYQPG